MRGEEKRGDRDTWRVGKGVGREEGKNRRLWMKVGMRTGEEESSELFVCLCIYFNEELNGMLLPDLIHPAKIFSDQNPSLSSQTHFSRHLLSATTSPHHPLSAAADGTLDAAADHDAAAPSPRHLLSTAASGNLDAAAPSLRHHLFNDHPSVSGYVAEDHKIELLSSLFSWLLNIVMGMDKKCEGRFLMDIR
ncbi:hypothetical protein Droror1_Dr00017034 [Drosera rotundifolia]